MKKNIEEFAGFKIEWISVSRIGPQGHGVQFHFGKDFEHVIGFIRGWEWGTTKRVKVLVLSPKSKEWGSLLPDSKKILEDLKECVRIVLKNPDGKVHAEIKNNIRTWANA